ncbi:MAG TPA: SIS domain-containing protein [Candidatus Andersenbacteria bacterium]|nr:SIS domain-containing protein [Candidatus Andersenbacteria bacterium]
MREIILHQGDQIRHSIDTNKDVRVDNSFDSILLAGMGGSGHPGDLLNALNLTTVPLTVHRSYDLPHIFGKSPLTIVSSYSGNTEEALSAYEEAKKKNNPMLVNTSGGKLLDWAKQDNIPITFIDYAGMQPRHTLFASFTGLACALANSGLARDISSDLLKTAGLIDGIVTETEAPAKELADKLATKTPIFYASDKLAFGAKNTKIQTNENSKTAAFWNEFPEMNHNEMVGMTNPQADFHAVFFASNTDHKQVKLRMQVTKDMYEAWGVPVTKVPVLGANQLEQLSYIVVFGLWLTYHLAINYNVDPIPVQGVEDFKKTLAELSKPS